MIPFRKRLIKAKVSESTLQTRSKLQRQSQHGMGTAALAGLALLEAGIPENDPSFQNIAKFIRDKSLAQTSTYEISLTIMFLDQLGKKPINRLSRCSASS